MMLTRRAVTVGSAAAATAAAALTLAPDATAAPTGRHHHREEDGRSVLVWEGISFRTIYTDAVPATPVPVGVPVMGFVSLAMFRAVERSARCSGRQGPASASAAVGQAAHDVLVRYYPALAPGLDAELAAFLATLPPGRALDRGLRAGAEAAAAVLATRQGDGYLDPSIHYAKTPGPGVWTPNAGATDMLAPWLGSLRPLLVAPLAVSGPYSLSSAEWAADYAEAKRLGGLPPTERTQAQTDTAVFFDSNSARMVSEALVRYLATRPIGLSETARLFAMIHCAMTDSVINCWRLKRDVGFWRPFQAIAGPYDDGNPATVPQAGWTALRPMPNYSDYVSGHGSMTGPSVQVIRRTLGERVPLPLVSVNFPGQSRTYARLDLLEADAFMARIWGGFHFRKAMLDAYSIGHRTADRVLAAFCA